MKSDQPKTKKRSRQADYNFVVMPHGSLDAFRGRLVTATAGRKIRTPFIESYGSKYYPADAEWVYAWEAADRSAVAEAGFHVIQFLANFMYRDLIW